MRYGFEGTLRAQPGRGPELLTILLEAAEQMRGMDGCELYVVGVASDDPDVIRVSEVWTSKAAHDESLSLPDVRALIGKATPLMAARPSGTAWAPKGGKGLVGQRANDFV